MKKLIAICGIVTMLVTNVEVSAFVPENNSQLLEVQNEFSEVASDDVTRAEWLNMLITQFELTTDGENGPEHGYADVDETSEYYNDIMIAAEHGLIQVEAGEDIYPENPASREFAAWSLNFCLKIHNTEEYSFLDAEDCQDPDSAQVAINRGWLKLIDDKFLPNQPITVAEAQNMMDDAKEIEKDGRIEETESEYKFADWVVVLPKTATVFVDENDFVTISDTDIIVEEGDTFVVWMSELPSFYVAESVERLENKQVIETSEADVDAALLDVKASGSVDIDLKAFEGEKGFDVEYIENEAQARRAISTYGISVKKDSVIATKDFEITDGMTVSFTCNLSKLKLNHKAQGKSQYYLTVSGDYTITSSVSLDVLAALNGKSSLVIGAVSVAGVGVVKIAIDLNLKGEIAYTYTGNFEVGIRQLSSGDVSFIHKFNKTGFYEDIQAEAMIALKVSFGVDAYYASGEIYASTGIDSIFAWHDYNDGKRPNNCSSLRAWWFIKAGYSVKLGVGKLSQSESESIYLYDKSNSPIQLHFHWEDGRRVYNCARKESKYITSFNSRYGNSSYGGGNSTGYDGSGNPYTLYDYNLDEENNATITAYYGNASAVSVPKTIDGYTVVAIGAAAFQDKSGLVTVTIPDSVKAIQDYAFAGCISLKSVKLSKNLVELGSYAFSDCDVLRSIHIPKSLEDGYAQYPFGGCDGLKTVTIEDGTTKIVDTLFGDCPSLTNIEIPDTVIQIGAQAFARCTSLKEIEIPDSVTEIHGYAFVDCSFLERIKLSENLMILGESAFSNCDALESIQLPKSLEDGHAYYPFGGCDGLKTVIIEDGTTKIVDTLFGDCPSLTNIEIPDTVMEIGTRAFDRCTSLDEIEMPDSVTEIHGYAFADCSSLERIKLSENLLKLEEGAFSNCDMLDNVNLPKSLEQAYMPFVECDGLRTVVLEEGTEKILGNLFSCCTGTLENLQIPDSVKAIESNAFYSCSGLKKLELPNTITELGNSAFSYCSSLEQAKIPKGVTKLPDSLFAKCSKLSVIELPDSLTRIDHGAFWECDMLTSIEIPDSVTEMGEGVFCGCNMLTTIRLSNALTELPTSLFSDCDKLETIVIPNSVKTLGKALFYNCDSLKNVTFGEGITEIGYEAFANCDSLETVVLPNGVKILEGYIFNDCDALKDVTLGNSITIIPESMFESCNILESIHIPYRVTEICENAFKACVKFSSITIPRATENIAENAFSYPSKLTIYGVAGTYAETFAEEIGCTFENREVHATDVSLSKESLQMFLDNEEKLTIKITPIDFTDEVAWKSTNESVVTVTEDGTVSAVGVGTATIKVTVGDQSASCRVSVIQPIADICLNETELTLNALDTFKLVAEIFPDDAYNPSVVWSSSDATIVSVNENGVITAHKKGIATITVRAQDGSNTAAECIVTVSNNGYIVTDLEMFESEHNYKNNCTDYWIYTDKTALMLLVTFSENTEIEDEFDYLYIYDVNGKEIGTYTGKQLAGKTITVPGNTVKIQLQSDKSGNAWGFKIAEIKKQDKLVVAPSTLALQLTGHDDIKVSWSKVNGADGYIVYYKTATETKYSSVSTTKTSVTLSNKNDSAKYVVRVYSYDLINGEKIRSAKYIEKNITTLRNLVTPKVTLQLIAHDDVKVGWQKVTGATGYYVYYKKVTQSTYSAYKLTTNTSITLKDLADSTKYNFKVVPYGMSGNTKIQSDNYATKSITTLRSLAAPKVTLQLIAYDDVKVGWQKVTGAAGYYVYYKKATQKAYSSYKLTTNTSITLKNLASNTKYNFKVVPYGMSGNTKIKSDTFSTKTITTLRNLAKPSKLTLTAVSKTKMKATWSKVSCATGYYVYYKKSTASKYVLYTTTKARSVTISGLKKNTKYTVKIVPYGVSGSNKIKSNSYITKNCYTRKK